VLAVAASLPLVFLQVKFDIFGKAISVLQPLSRFRAGLPDHRRHLYRESSAGDWQPAGRVFDVWIALQPCASI
jgi:hypothetical protein